MRAARLLRMSRPQRHSIAVVFGVALVVLSWELLPVECSAKAWKKVEVSNLDELYAGLSDQAVDELVLTRSLLVTEEQIAGRPLADVQRDVVLSGAFPGVSIEWPAKSPIYVSCCWTIFKDLTLTTYPALGGTNGLNDVFEWSSFKLDESRDVFPLPGTPAAMSLNVPNGTLLPNAPSFFGGQNLHMYFGWEHMPEVHEDPESGEFSDVAYKLLPPARNGGILVNSRWNLPLPGALGALSKDALEVLGLMKVLGVKHLFQFPLSSIPWVGSQIYVPEIRLNKLGIYNSTVVLRDGGLSSAGDEVEISEPLNVPWLGDVTVRNMPKQRNCQTWGKVAMGKDYIGDIGKAKFYNKLFEDNGLISYSEDEELECVPWKDVNIHGLDLTSLHSAKNSCRNPGGLPGVWCFVNQSMRYASLQSHSNDLILSNVLTHPLSWAYCDVPRCGENYDMCQWRKDNGQSYNGQVSKTKTGKPCMPWNKIDNLSYGYLGGNSCRNPDGERDSVWCFTDMGGITPPNWEYCDVPDCSIVNTELPLSSTINNNTSQTTPQPGQELGDGTTKGDGKEHQAIPLSITLPAIMGGIMVIAIVVIAGFVKLKRGRKTCTINNTASHSSTAENFEHFSDKGSLDIEMAASSSACSNEPLAAAKAKDKGSSSSSKSKAEAMGSGQHSLVGTKKLYMQSPVDIGEVELVSTLGTGSTAVVWRGTWLKQPVAVKIVNSKTTSPKLFEKFCFGVETNLAKQLSHPNIVRTYQVYTLYTCTLSTNCSTNEDSEPFLRNEETLGLASQGPDETKNVKEMPSRVWAVQELCDMGDLAGEEARQLLVDSGDALTNLMLILHDIASALHYLHGNGVVHGDLKRENILMQSVGGSGYHNRKFVVKMADFGMAHFLDGKESYYAPMGVIGDFRYLAPEAISANKVSSAMDVYSFGILMYELCTWEKIDATLMKLSAGTWIDSQEENGAWLQASQHGIPGMANLGSKLSLAPYRQLAEKCWSPNSAERPSAAQLLQEVNDVAYDLLGHKIDQVNISSSRYPAHVMSIEDNKMLDTSAYMTITHNVHGCSVRID